MAEMEAQEYVLGLTNVQWARRVCSWRGQQVREQLNCELDVVNEPWS